MYAYSSGVCRYGGDDEQEVESDEELKGEGLPNADRRDGDAAGHERVEDRLESERSAYGRRYLSGDVRGNLNPREMAKRGEGNREGWVEVSSGDVAGGQNHYHHRQPCACRIPDQGLRASVLLVDDRARRRSKDQDEGSHELCSELPWN